MPEYRSAELTLGLQNEVVNNMNRKTQSDKQSMTPLQRQAVLVCAVCALAALLTIGITLTLLRRGKTGTPDVPADSSSAAESGADGDLADHYQIDNTSSALLTETADAGTEYLDSTLFSGRFQHGPPVQQRPDLPAAVLRQRGHRDPGGPE